MSRIGDFNTLCKFGNMTEKMGRRGESVMVQARTGHIPLWAFLKRIKKEAGSTCLNCGQGSEETVEHFILECPAYKRERQKLRAKGRGKHRDWKWLLGTKIGMREVVKFIGRTERLKGVYGSVQIVEEENNQPR